MSTILEIQDALIETLKSIQDASGSAVFKSVEAWISSDASDVENTKGIRPPVAYVVFLGANGLDESQETTRWGIFTITGGVRDKAERNRNAIKTAELVVDGLRNNRLGLKKVSATRTLGIENLYSDSLDKNGMGLFGISFEIKRHR